MRFTTVGVAAFVVLAATAPVRAQQAVPAYQDPTAPLEARVDDLFGRLTPEEKLSLCSGTGFTTQPISRLAVPAMGMVDGPQGVRGGTAGTQGPATLFTSGVALASTWDRDLVRRVARAIGEETRNKGEGAFVLLGPDINIHRSPLGGRNGESFSEDPFLTAQLTIPYVMGIQSAGVAACVKHYACNNEEGDRNTVDVRVDERTLREIYLPAFEAGVRQGHSWTIMAAYNRINGPYATANHYLLTDVLKRQWGFDGLVMSDWGAVHETVGVVNAGNDLEMPGGQFQTAEKLKAALDSGTITQAAIDESVHRILRTILRVGLLDGSHAPDASKVNSPEHQRLTFEAASEGIVLLKNERHTLPLDRTRLRSVAVIGPAAVKMQFGALGSPAVTPFYSLSPVDGIKKLVGDTVAVNVVEGVGLPAPFPEAVPTTALRTTDGQPGLRGEYFTDGDLQGEATGTRVDSLIQIGRNFAPPTGMTTVGSIRWTGTLTATTGGEYTFSLRSSAGCRLLLNGKPVFDEATTGDNTPRMGKVTLTAGKSYDIRVEVVKIADPLRVRLAWSPPVVSDIPAAVAAAAKSDVAIVFATTLGQDGEGRDRPSMALPGEQDRLIRAVAAANKRTIIVLNAGTPCQMTEWLGPVPAVLNAGFPGQEGGRAIASVLFGDVNPSGKLVDTFGARREDYPDFGNFPGVNGVVHYSEGIYVGYRHFDKDRIAPLFPFGYGLSYTTFRYANLKMTAPTLAPDGSIEVRVDITNTGTRAGTEVAELYVRDPQPKIDKPIRELKGFERVALKPGETQTVHFILTPQHLAYYDVSGKQWKADAGTYLVEIGASSRDLRQTGRIQLTGTYTKPVQ